ncbi:unnamed protein product [Parnassius apollo]|uniref:(apollo) hypothetical protein n=1 Tax=Parnassius apollo TaxID=110799 RepID=A0A8S3X3P9_PARAO|nr:unnamed protein product [Parnassius apollo]
MTEPTLLETINYSSITPSTSVTSHNNIDKETNNDRVSISPNLSFADSNVQDLSHEIGSQNMDLHETYVQDVANNIEDGSNHECLVPYDIHSDSMSDSDYRDKSKKRKKRAQMQKSNWFAEKNRKLRESGKKYYGRKKEEMWNIEIPKEPRIIKQRCKCKQTEHGTIKCSSFTEEDRK